MSSIAGFHHLDCDEFPEYLIFICKTELGAFKLTMKVVKHNTVLLGQGQSAPAIMVGQYE